MIEDYLAQTIWRKPRTGTDGYGQPTFGEAEQLAGRWIEKRRLVRNLQGEQVTSEVTVTVAPAQEMAVGDQLSCDGTTYLIAITVSASRDLGGEASVKRIYL